MNKAGTGLVLNIFSKTEMINLPLERQSCVKQNRLQDCRTQETPNMKHSAASSNWTPCPPPASSPVVGLMV